MIILSEGVIINIQDVEDLKEVKEPWLDFLLDRQSELIEKYKKIEGMPDPPMDINTKEAQIWVKDFLWRVTEELMEAYEAKLLNHDEHFLEELSDALHFYLEIFILVDCKSILYGVDGSMDDYFLKGMIRGVRDFKRNNTKQRIFDIIYHLGLAGNFLRNKKWKQTQVFVDKERFYEELKLGFVELIGLIIESGIKNKYDLLNLYYKKFIVNQFRQRSNY